MSNPEDRPAGLSREGAQAAGVEILAPREVPLGGPRAMAVRRTLPQRHRSTTATVVASPWAAPDDHAPRDQHRPVRRA